MRLSKFQSKLIKSKLQAEGSLFLEVEAVYYLLAIHGDVNEDCISHDEGGEERRVAQACVVKEDKERKKINISFELDTLVVVAVVVGLE